MKKKKLYCYLGQGTLEYVVLVAVVVASLMAMGVYMKRGAQGRLRTSLDEISQHYNPRTTVGVANVETTLDSIAVSEGGLTTTGIINQQDKTSGEYVRIE